MRNYLGVNIKLCAGGQYARRVISRSRFRPTFVVPCAKPKGQHPAESPLERDAHFILNLLPNVGTYRAQPAVLEMSYTDAGVPDVELHYPDVLADFRQEKAFIEIKLSRDAAHPDIQRRTEFLIRALPEQGYSYYLWTEHEIREPAARLDNARRVLRLGRGQRPSLPELEIIRKFLEDRVQVSWGEIREGVFGSKGLHHVCRLLMDGVLECDVNSPITDQTWIRWATAEIRPPPIG